ncbi:Uncharacterised protein [Bordetella pertussis]|nr:Uncharacterised protein [Bordetella pertussis]
MDEPFLLDRVQRGAGVRRLRAQGQGQRPRRHCNMPLHSRFSW